jgi:RimJ/RimL family protein N-acetyltransferase
MIVDLPRLRLRPFGPVDAEPVVAALNDWAVAQWLIAPPHPYGHGDFERYAEIVRRDHDSEHPTHFAIAHRESDELAGCMAVVVRPDGVGELGYWLARADWRRGYAGEAATAVIASAWRHPAIRRLVATTDPENAPSRRLLAKAGFTLLSQTERDQPTRRGTTEVCLYEYGAL